VIPNHGAAKRCHRCQIWTYYLFIDVLLNRVLQIVIFNPAVWPPNLFQKPEGYPEPKKVEKHCYNNIHVFKSLKYTKNRVTDLHLQLSLNCTTSRNFNKAKLVQICISQCSYRRNWRNPEIFWIYLVENHDTARN
jgi:hypothetical protein